MILRNKIFGFGIILSFLLFFVFFLSNTGNINQKYNTGNINQKYNTGNINQKYNTGNVLISENETKKIIRQYTIKQISNSDVKLTSLEKEKIIDFSVNKTDKQISDQLFSEGFDNYKNILTQKGKNINYTTEKIYFLYLCKVYSEEGKKKFDDEFIRLTFPEDIIKELNKKITYEYFYNKCIGNKVTILKGFEGEVNYGCPIKFFYYYNLFNNIDIYGIYSNKVIKNNITDYGEKIFYYFLFDVFSGKDININKCSSYLDLKYE